MRHGNKNNNLGRKIGHRRALMKNLANALIQHKRITTTLAKAKALRTYIEPLLTKGKDNTTHSRRTVFSYLQDKDSIVELFDTIGGKIAERNGGYTRIIKLGIRPGDAAEMAMIELVDFNTVYSQSKSAGAAKKKTTRRGRSAGTTAKTKKTKETAADTESSSEAETKE